MNAVIKSINQNSPLFNSIIKPGDILRKVNCNPVNDILDYEFYSYDSRILLEIINESGKIKLISINKPEGMDLGLDFEKPLLDDEKSCSNNCIFCFINQLPKGMRNSLYYKDDDVRLSFLQGNYVTLSNLTNEDVKRIIKQRISPINVSIHTLDPKLRSYMLGGGTGKQGVGSSKNTSTAKGAKGLKAFKALAKAGIKLNCQIVCCPGINDSRKLSKTIEGLIRLGDSINSVSVVPVGLTKYRENLPELRPFNPVLAKNTIRRVKNYNKRCIKKFGRRIFFCADELYMLAGIQLPENEHYSDYPQLENGVGMMRLLITEFKTALEKQAISTSAKTAEQQATKSQPTDSTQQHPTPPEKTTIITGTLAEKYLTNLLKITKEKYDTIDCEVFAVKNEFFGESITVSGLVTGKDIINQLKDKEYGARLLIPQNMLRAGDDVFLDDVTVSDIENELNVRVSVVGTSGADLLKAILDIRES